MSICVSAPETQPSRCVRSGGAFNQPCCSGVKLFSLIQLGEYLSQCPWKWRCINYTKLIFKNLIFLGRSTGHLFCFSNQQLSTLHTFISGSWPIQLQYSCPKAACLQWLREELFFHNPLQIIYLTRTSNILYQNCFSYCSNLEATIQLYLWKQLYNPDDDIKVVWLWPWRLKVCGCIKVKISTSFYTFHILWVHQPYGSKMRVLFIISVNKTISCQNCLRKLYALIKVKTSLTDHWLTHQVVYK